MSNLARKLGQIGPKLDKSGTFSDQFQCFSTFWLVDPKQNVQISDLKEFLIYPIFGANPTLVGSQSKIAN